jgi:hypothetical protein
MYTPLEQTRCAHWDAAAHPHTLFSPTLLAFLILRFFPPFRCLLGGRVGKRNGQVINKNQFSCYLSPFAFCLAKTYGALLDTGGGRDGREM